MNPNLDFFRIHTDIRSWRFIVALASLVLAFYTYTLVSSTIDNEAASAAASASIVTCYGASLYFQLRRHPNKNRYWVVVIKPSGEAEAGGPYNKDTAWNVFNNVCKILQEGQDTYKGMSHVWLIQTKDEETAIKEAREGVELEKKAS